MPCTADGTGRSSPASLPQELRCGDNRLAGTLPAELGRPASLRALGLSRNLLRGPIPRALAGLTSLRELDLSGNALGGTLPAELVALQALID